MATVFQQSSVWTFDPARSRYYYYSPRDSAYIYEDGYRIPAQPESTSQLSTSDISEWIYDPVRGEDYYYSQRTNTWIYRSGYEASVAPPPPPKTHAMQFKCSKKYILRSGDQMRKMATKTLGIDAWKGPLEVVYTEDDEGLSSDSEDEGVNGDADDSR
jgi:hypothetical protein